MNKRRADSTSTPRNVANVSGSVMRMVVPEPRRLSIATRPPSLSAFSRTIASPKPRPGYLRDHRTGGYFGLEDQRQRRGFAELIGSVRCDDSAFDGRRLDLLDVDARTIVADGNLDLGAVHRRYRERDLGARWLAGAPALLGRLDAVVDAIAQQVNERVLQLLQDALVDRDFLATDREFRLLALIAALIANQLGEQSRTAWRAAA